MAVCVIAHKMSLVPHALDKLRGRCYKITENKESAADILFFKRVKYLYHIAVFISGVEGQIHNTVVILISLFLIDKITAVTFYKRKLRGTRRALVAGSADAVPIVRRAFVGAYTDSTARQKYRSKHQ